MAPGDRDRIQAGGSAGDLPVLMRYVLPRLLHLLARSQELLLVFALAWGTALATAGDMLGFSKEVGAFLAGFSLPRPSIREAVASRLTGLRDFLLLFFFIDLGAKLDLGTLGAQAIVPTRSFVAVCPHRQPADRDGDHGLHGIPQAHRLSRRPDGCADQRVLHRVHRHGHQLGHIAPSALGLVTLVGW